jgi:hypothetical protein
LYPKNLDEMRKEKEIQIGLMKNREAVSEYEHVL